MSRKPNRRQQRQLEELQELQAIAQDTAAPEPEEVEAAAAPVAPAAGFAALQLDEPEEEDEPEPQPAQKRGKKKKNKKSSKAKKQEPKAADVNAMSIEEITAILEAESAPSKGTGPESNANSSQAAASATPAASLRAALSLEAQQLDPQVELRRQFGAAAIKAYEKEKGSVTTRAGARRGGAYNSNMRARTILSTPKPTWPDMGRTVVGLTMDVDETPRGRLCSWTHSRAYRQAQMQFAQAVNAFDTDALYALFRVFPWHIDTLLQLSDISRYQGDLGQASDFIERALFALERAASPQFVTSLTSSAGPMGVDFLRAENRAVWLALHRNIDLLCRRGTWRTALEWCKLMFALDMRDPHGAMMWMDFVALKSGQHAWLLQFYDKLEAQRAQTIQSTGSIDNYVAKTALDSENDGGALDWSVGVSFSRALALWALEKEQGDKTAERSSAALRLAIARHPAVVPIMCAKLDIPAPQGAQFAQREQWSKRDDALDELLGHLYIHRSLSLWKDAPVLSWFRRVLEETLPRLGKYVRGNAEDDIKLGIYRHVVVADLPEALNQQLMRYFPPDVRSPAGGVETFDPLPPSEGTRYGNDYYASLGQQTASREVPADNTFLQQILARIGNIDMDQLNALVANLDDETRDQYVGALLADIAGGHDGGADADADANTDADAEQQRTDSLDDAAGDSSIPQAATADADGEADATDLDHDAAGTGDADSRPAGESADAPGLLQRLWSSVWGA
ncbi:hypothetical protein MCUN1_000872 [Malassezia cuniculi]|uniref:Transcription factor 25 n=1 Tax=Malassezia cuniculi TaxID=948313 RepID=A0AAF0ES50_9BASI|nr:hypothetical protein MCUN1_000872 [Malassezia cuniculi]